MDTCIKMSGLFQSTLPRRERQQTLQQSRSKHWNFNPRSREGSDGADSVTKKLGSISIHAPAKGATVRNGRSAEKDSAFQSTLPRRERQRHSFLIAERFLFQSTLPRRERPDQPTSADIIIEFQSTLPRRERPFYWNTMTYMT